jgi:hypothetical protein
MSKYVAIILTAAVCLPLGALLRGEASAEGRRVLLVEGANPIEGHRHLSRVQTALHEALHEIEASERTNEPLWNDQTGRAAATKEAIERAAVTMDRTADWVRKGMALNAQNIR